MNRKTRYRPEHMRLLNSKRWAETKAIVDARSEGLCEWCKRDGQAEGRRIGDKELAAMGWVRTGVDHHHIIPFESAKTMAEAERLCYDPNNVVLLCVDCHRKEHNRKGYHTKAAVADRRAQAFARWEDRWLGKSEDE